MKLASFLIFLVTTLIVSASFSMEKEASKSVLRTDELKTSLVEVCTRLKVIAEELGQASKDSKMQWRNAELFAESPYPNAESFNVLVDVPLTTQRESAITSIQSLFGEVLSLVPGVAYPCENNGPHASKRTKILRTLKMIQETFETPNLSQIDTPQLRESLKKLIESLEKDNTVLFRGCFIEKVVCVFYDTLDIDKKMFDILVLLYNSENQKNFRWHQKYEWFQDVCGWIRKCPDALKEDNQGILLSFKLFREKCARLRQRREDLLEEKKRLKEMLTDTDESQGDMETLEAAGNLRSFHSLPNFKRKKLNMQLIDSPYAILIRKFDLNKAFIQDRIKAFLLLQDIIYWLRENQQTVKQLIQHAEQNPSYPFENELYHAYLAHRRQCFTIQNHEDFKIAPQVLAKFGYNLQMSENAQKNVLLTERGSLYEAALFGILLYELFHSHSSLSFLLEKLYREDINIFQIITAAHQFNLEKIVGCIFQFFVKNDAAHTLAEGIPLSVFPSISADINTSTLVSVLIPKVESMKREQATAEHQDDEAQKELDRYLSNLAPHIVGSIIADSYSKAALKALLKQSVLYEPLSEKIKQLMKKLVILKPLSTNHALDGEMYCFQNVCVIQAPNLESSKKDDNKVHVLFFQPRVNTATQSSKKWIMRLEVTSAVIVHNELYASVDRGHMLVFPKDEVVRALAQNRAPMPSRELPATGSLCPAARKHGWYIYVDPANGETSLRAILSFAQPDGRTCLRLYNTNTGTVLTECTLHTTRPFSLTVTPQYCFVNDDNTVILLANETLKHQKQFSVPATEWISALSCQQDTLFIITSERGPTRLQFPTVKLYSWSVNTGTTTSLTLPTLDNESIGSITLLKKMGSDRLLAVFSSAIFVIDTHKKIIIKQFRYSGHSFCKPGLLLDDKDDIVVIYNNLEAVKIPKKRLVNEENSQEVDKTFSEFIS